ncbi:unnamed protein product [Schistosoma rodhaini]|uniref:Uncharacterized protein n=1 Tax=Schistosoma rodhaini TaxID=6188 RepID=A0AA85GIH7_9TREM|nr:unnamed protein product [Schistosoma rodhaini]
MNKTTNIYMDFYQKSFPYVKSGNYANFEQKDDISSLNLSGPELNSLGYALFRIIFSAGNWCKPLILQKYKIKRLKKAH